MKIRVVEKRDNFFAVELKDGLFDFWHERARYHFGLHLRPRDEAKDLALSLANDLVTFYSKKEQQTIFEKKV